jgi:hypothetical protein
LDILNIGPALSVDEIENYTFAQDHDAHGRWCGAIAKATVARSRVVFAASVGAGL